MKKILNLKILKLAAGTVILVSLLYVGIINYLLLRISDNKRISYYGEYELVFAYVSYVIDGDTVILSDGTRIRYLGIDTPEISHLPGEYDEPGARVAKGINRNNTEKKHVVLAIPGEREYTHGRLLAYVYAPVKTGRSIRYTNMSVYLLSKGLGDTKYGAPDPALPEILEIDVYLEKK